MTPGDERCNANSNIAATEGATHSPTRGSTITQLFKANVTWVFRINGYPTDIANVDAGKTIRYHFPQILVTEKLGVPQKTSVTHALELARAVADFQASIIIHLAIKSAIKEGYVIRDEFLPYLDLSLCERRLAHTDILKKDANIDLPIIGHPTRLMQHNGLNAVSEMREVANG